MKRNFKNNLHQQIQIALFIFENQNKYSAYDLAERFFTSDSTIRRNVCCLRKMGIEIHSRKKTYFIKLTKKQFRCLVDAMKDNP